MPRVDGSVVLVMFDGWGHRAESVGNVIAEAETPNYDQLQDAYPHTLLTASGAAVGLSDNTVGSAGAGYATIAAGRPVEQPQLRLGRAVADGSFRNNAVLRAAADKIRGSDRRLHLLGLVSDGQVISAERHYFELLGLLAEAGVPGERVFIHAILDGYDTPPRSGMNYLARFAAEMMRTGVGRVATLLGRKYGLGAAAPEAAERAYMALVEGAGRLVPSAIQALQAGYSRGEDDSSLSPAVVLGSDGLPLGRLDDGDILLFFNHRDDGLCTLMQALLADRFEAFGRERRPAIEAICLTAYGCAAELGGRVAFPAEEEPVSLGARLTAAGKRVALVGETVMADHLRRLVRGAAPALLSEHLLPSPPAAAVIEQPERLTAELTALAVPLILGQDHALVVVDYVNADLAGHFAQATAARRAVEALDATLPALVRAARKAGATILLSACYGNVEELEVAGATLRPNPAHTANPVPLVLICDQFKGHLLPRAGRPTLADLAATTLSLLGVAIPDDYTGEDLSRALTPEQAAAAAVNPAQGPLEVSAVEALGMVILTQRGAVAYYAQAAEAASEPEAATLYRHLAAEESRRQQALERRYELLEQVPLAADERTMPALPPSDLPPLEVLEIAIREEIDTYHILLDLAARNVDPQGTTALEQLANEELDFLARLQQLSESEAIRVLASLPGAARLS